MGANGVVSPDIWYCHFGQIGVLAGDSRLLGDRVRGRQK